jgi:hypothetical protein
MSISAAVLLLLLLSMAINGLILHAEFPVLLQYFPF